MRIAFVTNLRAPYRTLQLNEYSKIEDVTLTAYYTDLANENRDWKVNEATGYTEVDLTKYKILRACSFLNKKLITIVKKNDLIILGGYEKITYILISIMCKILKKPTILFYDGISIDRLDKKENIIKKSIKKIVINNSNYIMGNGKVSEIYFSRNFNYPLNNIYNQYLSVDSNKINFLFNQKEKYRKEYREKLNICKDNKVLIYSGRLISIKNVESVVQAISKIKRKDIILLITGGGELEDEIMNLSKRLGVKTIITGFISEQEELFKHYFVGDALILPSVYEPWGLVVNEAMSAGLPVLVSKICGCSLDLVKSGENGYLIDPYDVNNIAKNIENVLFSRNIKILGVNSRNIISKWTYENSKKELSSILTRM